MTNGRFGQTPPDKANELFEKLLATSDAAVKTRERVFGDLRQELELLSRMRRSCSNGVRTSWAMAADRCCLA